jgi:hypothetical protein
MSLLSEILDTTLGGVIKTAAKKTITSTRGRGLIMAAAGYYGGNYAMDKAKQDLSAEYGNQVYQDRYGAGEDIGRDLLTGASLGIGVVGGVFGKSVTRLGLKAAKSVVTSPFKISFAAPSVRMPKPASYGSIRSRKSLMSAAVMGGLGYGYVSSLRRPPAVEGRNTEIYGQSSVSKMNFDTAGLVQALHNNRRRLM